MAKRATKIQISLTDEEISKIDDWQFDHRMPSRASAIRELIGRSIGSSARLPSEPLQSREIGVLSSSMIRVGEPSFSIAHAQEPDLPLIYVSAGFAELCGYEPDEVIGRNCRFLQGPNTDRRTTTKIREALSDYRSITTDIINYRKSGSAYRIELTIEPVFLSADNAPTLFVGLQRHLEDL